MPPVFSQVGRPWAAFRAPRHDSIVHEDVDEARNLLVQDDVLGGLKARIRHRCRSGVPGAASNDLGGVRYHTDGLRDPAPCHPAEPVGRSF
jgi:hypothetical protein